MNDKDDKRYIGNEDYRDLVMKLKKELPNIVLPSMGMLDDSVNIEINGQDYIISDSDKEV